MFRKAREAGNGPESPMDDVRDSGQKASYPDGFEILKALRWRASISSLLVWHRVAGGYFSREHVLNFPGKISAHQGPNFHWGKDHVEKRCPVDTMVRIRDLVL